ncbi:nucleotidyltransferase family protein [Candidatus Bipolaricaulota bacterium]|nr:nucleotidyltransferase family protein [Candidatus Bipolaricaulota bacterium]
MKPDPADPAAIILAAGRGERYDGVKQLARIDNKPLLQYVLDSVGEINWKYRPILVLGYEASRVLSSVNPEGFKAVVNENWREGMSTSLKQGITEAPEDSSGFIFFLADMPLISPAIIEKVLEKAADGASISAPVFQGERGFPVYLHQKWKPRLLDDVAGDKGARTIIEQNPEDLTPIPTENQSVVVDVNEKGDLSRIKSYLDEGGTEIVV